MIFYVGINLGLAAVFSFVRLVLCVTERRTITVSFRHQLFISRALLCVTPIATICAMWFVRQADMRWSLGSAFPFDDGHAAESRTFDSLSELSVASIHFTETEPFSLLTYMVLAALLGVALLKTLRTIVQYRELSVVLRGSVMLRRHMRTVIVVSDRIEVPFSLRTLRWRWVVLPNHLLGNREDLRFAVGHELQHHRHGDTSWAWISQALSILLWPNPLIHLWRRWHGNVQEMACDEALLERPGFKVKEYARCLLDVAARVLIERQTHQFAPSMAAPGRDGRATATLLQRRIEMLFASSSRRLSQPFLVTALALAICCGVCVSALAAGLTSASRENVADATGLKKADEALASSPVEPTTTNVEPDCEHNESPYCGSPTLLSPSEPEASWNNGCTEADDLQCSGETPGMQSSVNESDCVAPSLDRSASCAERN
jgi:beta-lactamase regulating signal transducer with metallopeptidase domain